MSDTTNAGHCWHECRMLPIESCYECNNRLEMKELYKPYGMIPVPSGNDISDFCGRYVCTASDDKEIKNYLGAFPKWCPLPNGTRRQPSAEHDAAIRNQTLERAFTLINDGKSALYERCPDGHWDQILQAKMDVLCWIEESLLTPPPPSDPHIEEFPESP